MAVLGRRTLARTPRALGLGRLAATRGKAIYTGRVDDRVTRESTFQQDTSIEPRADGTWQATLEKTWWVEQGPNGGYVAAILARALAASLDEPVPLRSITARYLRGADPGPVAVETRTERAGRTVATGSATMRQEGARTAVAQATFGAVREGLALERLDPPEALGWEEGMALPREGPLTPPRFTQHVEYRIAGGTMPMSGSQDAKMLVWMRPADPTPWEDALVAFLADAWMPAAFAAVDAPVGLPTIDLTVHLTGERPADAEDPVLGVFTADHAGEGYVVEDGDLWTTDGRLVARMRQLRRYLEP